MEVYEAGKVIGTLRAEPAGLFWEIYCKITVQPELLRRIFVLKGWKVEYLGIPDKNGELRGKIPQKRLPEGIETALASKMPREAWLPWRGEVDGVSVENACIRPTEEGIELALGLEETLKFPAWAENMKIESVLDGEMALLTLGPEGQLPVIEREVGGNTDETMDRSDFDFELPAEPAAYDCGGSTGDEEQGWQADCPDL